MASRAAFYNNMAPKYAKDQPAGLSNYIKNIAIVGATGSVGEHITEHLLKSGKHNVTAITRANSKSQMPSGVKVAKIDYEDQSTLVDALKGQDALIITMKTGQTEAQTKLIDAAIAAKVPWIMPNEYSPDVVANPEMGKESGLGPAIWAAHEQIEKSSTSSWIGLACSFWYPFSLAVSPHAYGFDIHNKKATFIDDGQTKISTSTWEQCGRAVANLFSLPILPQDDTDTDKAPYLSMWRNKEVHISSFLISQQDILDSLLRVTGTKESDWTIEYQPAEERWREAQELMRSGQDFFRGYMTSMYTRVFYKDGCGDFSDKLDNDKLGLPKESLDEATKEAIRLVEQGYNYIARG